MLGRALAGWTLVVVLALAPACEARLVRGAGCTRSSQCTAPLVCASGRCLEECLVQDDCPLGARCVLVLGLGRCLFDHENSCRLDEDCGDPAVVCRGARCFNRCDGCDALGGVCEGDVCVRVVPADAGSSDAGPSDAGTTDVAAPRDGGGAPVFSPHVPCVDAATCAPGEECVSDDGAASVCRDPCAGPVLTDGGSIPVDDPECGSRVCVRPSGDVTRAFCALTCDPLSASSCSPGDACDLVERLRPNTGEYRLVWGCRRVESPTLAPDEVCNPSAPGRCPAGTSCDAVGGGGSQCRPFCDDRSPTCLGSRACVSLHDDAYPIGVCAQASTTDGGPAPVDAGP